MTAAGHTDGRTLIKICGLNTAEGVRAAAEHGADLLGFVFAESRRRADPGQVAEFLAALGHGSGRFKAAGVFVDPGLAELERIMDACKLDIIQLHGKESPAFCRLVKVRFPGALVFKALGIAEGAGDASHAASGPAETAVRSRLSPYGGAVDGFLLDTGSGGTGRRFDWTVIPAHQAVAAELGVPLLVAGGLDPDNVAELVGTYRPAGVDVSSGVETDGRKDIGKIAAFIERVRNIDQQRT